MVRPQIRLAERRRQNVFLPEMLSASPHETSDSNPYFVEVYCKLFRRNYCSTCRHSPTYSIVTFHEIRRVSNFAHAGFEYTYDQLHAYNYTRDSSLNLTPTHWNHAAVHLRLTVLSLQQGKRRGAIQKCYYFNFIICYRSRET